MYGIAVISTKAGTAARSPVSPETSNARHGAGAQHVLAG